MQESLAGTETKIDSFALHIVSKRNSDWERQPWPDSTKGPTVISSRVDITYHEPGVFRHSSAIRGTLPAAAVVVGRIEAGSVPGVEVYRMDMGQEC